MSLVTILQIVPARAGCFKRRVRHERYEQHYRFTRRCVTANRIGLALRLPPTHPFDGSILRNWRAAPARLPSVYGVLHRPADAGRAYLRAAERGGYPVPADDQRRLRAV